jgi:hypothetical protein
MRMLHDRDTTAGSSKVPVLMRKCQPESFAISAETSHHIMCLVPNIRAAQINKKAVQLCHSYQIAMRFRSKAPICKKRMLFARDSNERQETHTTLIWFSNLPAIICLIATVGAVHACGSPLLAFEEGQGILRPSFNMLAKVADC